MNDLNTKPKELIDRESAIEAVSDIVSTVSVCATSEEARDMMRMKERAIEELREQETVEAIPVKWIVENHIIGYGTYAALLYKKLIENWRDENT